MKERFIETGIEYVRCGDYYIPNLTVPDDKVYNIGKYGRMHAKFIKGNRPAFYSMKMLNETWLKYLSEIDPAAKERYGCKARHHRGTQSKRPNGLGWCYE